MATEAARFKGKLSNQEKRKTKTTLTPTGLLMEGLCDLWIWRAAIFAPLTIWAAQFPSISSQHARTFFDGESLLLGLLRLKLLRS
jgi:hypothetical protein